jgi:hypothetical protein
LPNPGQASAAEIKEYQVLIGSLLYLTLGTRPDIAFAVTKMAQFTSNPSEDHLKKARYICRYLVGTKNLSLVYDGASGGGLEAFTDSDWGSDPSTRRSQSGYFFKLAGAAFSWTSRAQKSVVTSVTEAEYISLSDCCKQAVWARQLLEGLGYTMEAIPIAGDNQGSLFTANNPVANNRTKHIDIRYHYIRECIVDGDVEVLYLPGSDNPADLLTKNLAHVKFDTFRPSYGLAPTAA